MPRDILADPISRIYAVLSGLVFITGSIFGFNFIQDAKVNILANKALLTAKAARPFPYTSIQAANKWLLHMEVHKEFIGTERRLTELQIAATSSHLEKLITKLPRPPREVNLRLLAIERAQHALELEVARLKALVTLEQKLAARNSEKQKKLRNGKK